MDYKANKLQLNLAHMKETAVMAIKQNVLDELFSN